MICDKQVEMENLENQLMDKSVDDEFDSKSGEKFKINKPKKSKNVIFSHINFDKISSRH